MENSVFPATGANNATSTRRRLAQRAHRLSEAAYRQPCNRAAWRQAVREKGRSGRREPALSHSGACLRVHPSGGFTGRLTGDKMYLSGSLGLDASHFDAETQEGNRP